MKKQQARKIALNKETLRHLTGERLAGAVGGATPPSAISRCPETCKSGCALTPACPDSVNC